MNRQNCEHLQMMSEKTITQPHSFMKKIDISMFNAKHPSLTLVRLMGKIGFSKLFRFCRGPVVFLKSALQILQTSIQDLCLVLVLRFPGRERLGISRSSWQVRITKSSESNLVDFVGRARENGEVSLFPRGQVVSQNKHHNRENTRQTPSEMEDLSSFIVNDSLVTFYHASFLVFPFP